ncbi:Rhombotin-1, partial [Fragariocoptes setiger]
MELTGTKQVSQVSILALNDSTESSQTLCNVQQQQSHSSVAKKSSQITQSNNRNMSSAKRQSSESSRKRASRAANNNNRFNNQSLKSVKSYQGGANRGGGPNNRMNNEPVTICEPIGPNCVCSGCRQDVSKERFLLRALDQYWHEQCLKCDRCQCRLGETSGFTLYSKSDMILCRHDYIKFCVGDRFYLCENKIVCQYDYDEHYNVLFEATAMAAAAAAAAAAQAANETTEQTDAGMTIKAPSIIANNLRRIKAPTYFSRWAHF